MWNSIQLVISRLAYICTQLKSIIMQGLYYVGIFIHIYVPILISKAFMLACGLESFLQDSNLNSHNIEYKLTHDDTNSLAASSIFV
jgi:hypothetical protein